MRKSKERKRGKEEKKKDKNLSSRYNALTFPHLYFLQKAIVPIVGEKVTDRSRVFIGGGGSFPYFGFFPSQKPFLVFPSIGPSVRTLLPGKGYRGREPRLSLLKLEILEPRVRIVRRKVEFLLR